MAERTERLRHTLQELEAELSSLDSLDDETRQVLETALEDISVALRKTGSTDPDHHDSVVHRLQEAAEGFETSHPTLFGVVQRMIDALGQMGI